MPDFGNGHTLDGNRYEGLRPLVRLAWGVRLAGLSYTQGERNGFLYNGKEQVKGLGWYDYGFRWYMPDVGRFLGVDPLGEKFPWLTTYQYASNNPVLNIDLDGLEGVPVNDLNLPADPRNKPDNAEIEKAAGTLGTPSSWEVAKEAVLGAWEGMGNLAPPGLEYSTHNSLSMLIQDVFLPNKEVRDLKGDYPGAQAVQDNSVISTAQYGIGIATAGLGMRASSSVAADGIGVQAGTGGTNTVTKSESVLGHIFRDAPGHVNPSTVASQNRYISLFENVANKSGTLNPNVLSPAQRTINGIEGFSKTFRNGKQVWTQTKNGKIFDAGVNLLPK